VLVEESHHLRAGRGERRAHPRPDHLYWATRIGGCHMGAELAEVYGGRNTVSGVLLVRVRPAKIIARRNIAD
jgi:hypothetical protein